MGKIGGLALVAVLGLTGCSVAQAETSPTKRAANPSPAVMDTAKLGAFVKDVEQSGTDYATMPPADMAEMAKDLCQHYEGGFTTEDLRKSAGDKLAKAGEAARLTVCPPN